MDKFARKDQQMAALFLLGCVLFNFPVLAVFNVQGTLLGVPVLYAYLFVAWGLLIALMGLVIEKPD